MHDARAIANFFIDQAGKAFVRDVNAQKLNSLVYYAHGWHLAMFGTPLVDSPILATQDGVQVKTLAQPLESFGIKTISEPIRDLNMDPMTSGQMMLKTVRVEDAGKAARILSMTWKAYGKLSSYDLYQALAVDDSPWDMTWNRREDLGKHEVTVPDPVIQNWFRELAEKNRKRTQAPDLESTQEIVVSRTIPANNAPD